MEQKLNPQYQQVRILSSKDATELQDTINELELEGFGLNNFHIEAHEGVFMYTAVLVQICKRPLPEVEEVEVEKVN